MSKHLGCMSTVGIIAAFPPKLFLSLALLCHLYRANPFPCPFFFPPSASVKHKSIQSAHCQIFLVCVRTCVRVWLWEPERECAFTLWGRSFPRVRDVSEAQGFAQLWVFFFWLQHLFYYWQAKIGLGFVATTTSSELYCQNFGLLFFLVHKSTATDASTAATQLYIKKKERKKETLAEVFRKRQDDERPGKDQSLYIISARNLLVHLYTCFYPAGLCSFPQFCVWALPHAVLGIAR